MPGGPKRELGTSIRPDPTDRREWSLTAPSAEKPREGTFGRLVSSCTFRSSRFGSVAVQIAEVKIKRAT